MFKRKKKKVQTAFARQLITSVNPKSVIAEQFKIIRTNLNFSMPQENLRSIVITSTQMSEGKSTISSNLGVTYAQAGKKVIFVDADMRKPTVHHTFGLKNTTGLSNLLIKELKMNDVIQQTNIENLDVVTSGPIPPNPAELLTSSELKVLLEELKQSYDLVIFDAPPVLPVTDAQIISNIMDGTVLVVNSGETEKEGVLKAKELLEKSKANLLGVVLNNVTLEDNNYYYRYYG
ncbi:MAG: CpsD/CapB family tyrosine-protein kinase [Solibacillus sp.]